MVDRLRTDFQLSIITLLGASAIFGITPFAVYRFLEQNYLAGVTDSLIVVGIVACMIYAWRTGDTESTGIVLAIFCSISGVIISLIIEGNGFLWLYPVLIANFFLTGPRIAIALNSLAIAAVVIHWSIADLEEATMSFLATAIVVSACAFIFAQRNLYQRREMARLARRDPLTGARNRRSMNDALQLAASTAERTSTSYALIMLDLDHFKKINDDYGHSVGDRILIDLAELIENSTRRSDQLFRFGGEEFVLLMPGVDEKGMKAVVSSLRHKIRNGLRSPAGPVTSSFGAALLQPGEDWEAWLKRADDALYRAKDAGRDCIIIDEFQLQAAT